MNSSTVMVCNQSLHWWGEQLLSRYPRAWRYAASMPRFTGYGEYGLWGLLRARGLPITFHRTLGCCWLQHCRSLVRLLTFLGGRTIVCASQIVSPLGAPASSGKYGLIGGTPWQNVIPTFPPMWWPAALR